VQVFFAFSMHDSYAPEAKFQVRRVGFLPLMFSIFPTLQDSHLLFDLEYFESSAHA
jgi:hypothetical protein